MLACFCFVYIGSDLFEVFDVEVYGLILVLVLVGDLPARVSMCGTSSKLGIFVSVAVQTPEFLVGADAWHLTFSDVCVT